MINKGKRSKKTEMLEFLRKSNLSAIKKKAIKESNSYKQKRIPLSKMVINNCKENFIMQQSQSIDRELKDLDIILAKSVTSLQPSLKPEPSKSLYSASDLKVKTKLPLIAKREAKIELLEEKKKAISLIKDCCQAQLEEVRNRKELSSLIFDKLERQVVTNREDEDVNILKKLLKISKPNHKPAIMDNTLKKYYRNQNKFVSYRMFRENYLEVKDGIVHVLESDEK